MANCSFSSNTYDGRTLTLNISQEPDFITNSSALMWELVSDGGSSDYYAIYETIVVINGQQVYHKSYTPSTDKVFPAAKGYTSGEITVDHDGNGEASVDVVFKTAVYTSAEYADYGGTFTLDRITPIIQITEAYDFSDVDEARGGFVFTNSLGGSISDVTGTVSVGSLSKSQSIYTLAGGRVEFFFSAEEMDELRSASPTGTSEIVYTLSYTFVNNTHSVDAYATFTVDESDYTKPTINSVSISPNNGSMGSAFDGLYIQGRSKASVAVTATAKYGAWISDYTVTVGSNSYTSASSSFSTGYITSSAVVPVKVTVKDSRGFTATYNQNISVIEYSNPSVVPPVSAVECFRCDEGGNPSSVGDRVWINAKRSYSRLILDGVQKNFCLLRWRSKLDTSSTWGSWNTLIAKNSTDSDVFNGIISASLSHTSSFNIQIGVIDDAGGESYLDFDVPDADVALHLGEGGKAVGIGGYADTSNPESITMWWNTIFKEGFEINSVGMKIGSNMTDLANVPNGVTSGRYLKFYGSNGGNDNYYLLISHTGKLYVGIQINGASTITWTEK